MRDVIQKVMQAETEAKGLVEAARSQAEQILAEARKEAEALQASVRREANAEAERLVTAAAEAAEHEKQERLARAVAELKAQIRLDETVIQSAVDGVVRCVLGQHQSRAEPPP